MVPFSHYPLCYKHYTSFGFYETWSYATPFGIHIILYICIGIRDP